MIIKICTGSSCHLNGSYDVIQEFKDLLKKYDVEDIIELKASFCFNECINGVNVKCVPAGRNVVVARNAESFSFLYQEVLDGFGKNCCIGCACRYLRSSGPVCLWRC